MNRPLPSLDLPVAEDWRVLRLLSFYRLALAGLLLALLASDYTPRILEIVMPDLYRHTLQAYAGVGLLLAWLSQNQAPRIHLQALLNFLCDLLAVAALVYCSGGVDSGLGTLLLIPAVACALVVSPRLALAQAAMATLVMFAEEFYRTYQHGDVDGSGFTSTGVLGLIIFGTSITANTVAQRARKSEALARRVGSEYDSLSRLNDVVLESMDMGLLVVDENLHIANLNAAARELLRATSRAEGRALESECAPLAERIRYWMVSREIDDSPVSLGPNMAEANIRLSRLGVGPQAPILVEIEDASRLQEQAQQIKLAALGRLSASIAHEIRNPLSAISHAGQLLMEAPDLEPDNKRLLGMIQRHSDRIDKIINDVMALSRREAARPEAIPLAAWLRESIDLYRESNNKGSRAIELGEVPRDVRVLFDPRHLQQLIFNLWDNAFRHGASHADKFEVRVSHGMDRNGRPWIDIADNGPGITPDVLERIFEPFFTTSHGGTGLGLYLCRELCEFNQARLSYQRRPVGACFRISFMPGGMQ